jgi:hypothetical protein
MTARTVTPAASRKPAMPRYVSFQYGAGRYTVNPDQSKVYRNWVEVETSRAAEILTAFRHARQQ